MFETILHLIEKPERKWKLILVLIKALLSLIFASHLYNLFYGPFNGIALSDYNHWFSLAASGKVLICIFLFLLSEVALFYILPVITTAPFTLAMLSKPGKSDSKFSYGVIKFLFQKMDVIQINEETKRLTAGENIEFIRDLLAPFQHKNTKTELINFQNSFLSEIIHTYLVFVLIYFFIIHHPSSLLLNSIVISGVVLLLIAYISINAIFKFIKQESKDLLLALNDLIYTKLIYNCFNETQIFLHDAEENKLDKYFFLNDKQCFVVIFSPNFIPKKSFIDNLKQMTVSKNCNVLFVSEFKSNNEYIDSQVNDNDSIIHIPFKSTTDFKIKLAKFT